MNRLIATIAAAFLLAVPAAAADCRAVVEQAIDAGVVVLDSANASGATVVVSSSFWRGSDYATRRGIINALDCAIAGEGNTLKALRLIGSATGKVVARKERGRITISE